MSNCLSSMAHFAMHPEVSILYKMDFRVWLVKMKLSELKNIVEIVKPR